MRFKKTLYSLSLLLVSTLATAQDQEQNQENSNSPNPLSGLNSFLKGVGNSINSAAAQIQSGAKTGNQVDHVETTTRKRLNDTGLKGIFNAASSVEWPRLAVTINTLPKWFYYMPPSGMPGKYSPSDCINISITAWQNKKTSKTYDNIDFCGDDIISETPFADVGLTWKSFGMASTTSNTGGMRTRGPLPPQRLFPNKPGLDMFFHLNGDYYVGSIMATLGYNWKEPQDFRFWVVNLPTQEESVRGK